jgi:lactate racemase
MLVHLAFGKTGLPVELPDDWSVDVIRPTHVPTLPNPESALIEALNNPIDSPPLRDMVSSTDKVGIVFSDITRPAPSHLLIPAVLSQLQHLPQDNITLFNALGTHRPNTDTELRAMLGSAIVDNQHIVQNDAFDKSTQVFLGQTTYGHDIWLNRELTECDVVILTGFIEPHFFAGFSGGGKAIMPGMAGQETVLGNHDAQMIANPQSTWGITKGNPIWEEIQEVAHQLQPIFLLNVALNKDKGIAGIFAGSMDEAHRIGCAFVKETAMIPVDHPYDIVITSNSGYPLDLNLYQSVKGMSAAAQIAAQGGAIVIAADCWDGIPDHGLYGQLLRKANSPQDALDRIHAPGFLQQDQWQVQIQAQIQLSADVYVHSQNLGHNQIEEVLLKHSPDVTATVSQLVRARGGKASICVLPEGPQTIPFVQSAATHEM